MKESILSCLGIANFHSQTFWFSFTIIAMEYAINKFLLIVVFILSLPMLMFYENFQIVFHFETMFLIVGLSNFHQVGYLGL